MDAAHNHGPRVDDGHHFRAIPVDNKPILKTKLTPSRPSPIRSVKIAVFLDDFFLSSTPLPRCPLLIGGLIDCDLRKIGRDCVLRKEPDSSAEEDEGVDESENQEEGSLGRHGGHTARNGLASATLPVRVTSRLSVTRTSSPITATTQQKLLQHVIPHLAPYPAIQSPN